MHQIKNARWFKRTHNKQKLEDQVRFGQNNMQSSDLERTSWIDASTVTILLHALQELLEYLTTAPPDDFGGIRNKHMTKRLFERLRVALHNYLCSKTSAIDVFVTKPNKFYLFHGS